MSLTKKAIAAAAAGMLLLGAGACSRGAGRKRAAAPAGFRLIRVFISPHPKSPLPYEGDHYADGQLTEILFNNLVRANYVGSLSPELAVNWEISPDHREYTFQLRKNVRFHDGRPFTAADVRFTLETLIEKAQGKYAEINFIDGYEDYLARKTDHVRGIRIIDDHILQIRLNAEFKFFLQFLAAEYAAVLPAGYGGRSEEDFRRNPVGTGPFRLARTGSEADGSIRLLVSRLEKNRNYFAAAGNLDAIDFCSANTTIDSASKERFDLLYLSNSEIAELAGRPGYKIINAPPSTLSFIVLNPKENSWIQDRKVRQLVNYAIRREELVRKVFSNQALPAHSMMPFGLLGHNPYQRLDYARAERLRAELPPGRISFTIMTVAKDERQRVAEFVRQELARYDVDVKVITIDDQSDFFTNRIYHTDTSVVLAGIHDYPASYHFLTNLVEPHGYFNVFQFSLPELQAKIKTLPGVETVQEARVLSEISAAFESDSRYIPLYHYANYIAIRDRIQAIEFKYGETPDFAALEVAE